MIRVIAFLGKLPENPRLVTYAYDGFKYQGVVFPEALCQFMHFDEMIVFVTEVARQTAYPYLDRLGDQRIVAVDIPDGRTPDERRLIFEKLLNVVEDGDRVIFDVTHGFRSIPFFAFLAVAFLKSARQNVTVERILYGELGQDGQPGQIIDLTEYLDLLDWMSATDQFVNLGNSHALVNRVKEAALDDQTPDADRSILQELATSLDNVSRSLHLAIPDMTMSAAFQLQNSLDQAREILKRDLRPFLPLANRVEAAFEPMMLADASDPANVWRTLTRERAIVNWYLERKLLFQAIAMAFEWLRSYGLAYCGSTELYRYRARNRLGNQYNTIYSLERQSRENELSPRESEQLQAARTELESIPNLDRLLDLYKQAKELRNDLMHISRSHRTGKTPADREEEIREVCRQLNDFPLPDM